MNLLGRLVVGVICLFSWVSLVGAQATTVEKGKKVKFDYTLKVEGKVLESSVGKTPLEFTPGEGTIIPGLEKQLMGLKVGDEKTVTVTPEEGYGAVNPQALMDVPKTAFPKDFDFTVGNVIEMSGPKGESVPGIIAEVKADAVVVNFNHPLAGKTLEFDVKIIAIE